MNTVMKEKEDVVLFGGDNADYRVCFSPKENHSEYDIVVQERRMVEILLLSLGEKMSLSMDSQEQILNKDLFYDMYGKTAGEILSMPRWNYKKPEETVSVIGKIKMPEYMESMLTKNGMPIPKEYVHKIEEENVMISYPERYGNMLYFLGFNQTNEIISDHVSDHLDGIKLFEVVRQATIASLHVVGLPLGGVMTLTTSLIHFVKYVELSRPYFIQTIPVGKKTGGLSYVAFNVIQDGKSHATGYLGIYTFKSKKDYERIRK